MTISMNFHVGYKHEVSGADNPFGQTEYFMPQTLRSVPFLQKENTHNIDGWQIQIKIPGYILQNSDFNLNIPGLLAIGKIFIVSILSYSPCKFLLLFPFHGFS